MTWDCSYTDSDGNTHRLVDVAEDCWISSAKPHYTVADAINYWENKEIEVSRKTHCNFCGAPLKLHEEYCEYCGCIV